MHNEVTEIQEHPSRLTRALPMVYRHSQIANTLVYFLTDAIYLSPGDGAANQEEIGKTTYTSHVQEDDVSGLPIGGHVKGFSCLLK